MKTYALLFAWVFVFLAYKPAGDISDAPVFWTLLLIGAAVEVLGALGRYHAEISEAECRQWFYSQYRSAKSEYDLLQAAKALSLFNARGAA